MEFKAKVYVAGPYTNGDVAQNVAKAIDYGNRLLQVGFAPFIPHLTHFWHFYSSHEYETWLSLDKEFLKMCDYVLRFPGISNGADLEVELARKLNIVVVYSIEELLEHFVLKGE